MHSPSLFRKFVDGITNLYRIMKRVSLILGAALCTLSAQAQPQLRPDNIDEVLKAMTL